MTSEYLLKIIGEQYKFNKDERFKVEKLISKLINSDCRALSVETLEEEIIFNKFNEEYQSFKENIMNNIIRQTISTNPHGSILVQLYRYEKNANINIYMFKKYPFRIQINYNIQNKEFNVYGFMSEEHCAEYHKDIKN